uniref:Thiamin pyrophosphokinase catalytic domain-containing protein n=1 Tax=Leersia perrieri TaxID=77586 RepID=A0A0D9V0S5_9ORYZ
MLGRAIRSMDVMVHSSTFLLPKLHQPGHTPAKNYALVVLNQNLPRFMPRLWTHAKLRICADGGANRIFDEMFQLTNEQDYERVRNRYIPEIIEGDMDSIRPEVKRADDLASPLTLPLVAPGRCTTTTRFSTMFVFKHIYYAIELWVAIVTPLGHNVAACGPPPLTVAMLRGTLLSVAPLSVDFSPLHRHGASLCRPLGARLHRRSRIDTLVVRTDRHQPSSSTSPTSSIAAASYSSCRPLQAGGPATSTSATDIAFASLVLLLHFRLRPLHLVAYISSSLTTLRSSPATACCSSISSSLPFSRRDCLGGLLC